LAVSHPVTRTTVANVDMIFGFDYKQIRNYLLKTIASNDQLRVLKAGISADYIDSFKGRSYFSLIGYNGIDGILGGLKHDDPRASRLGAGGEFIKAELQLARIQKFFLGSYILLRCASQVASDVLPIPEQIAIGGADTVRGYPQSEYLGDHGYTATGELRFPPYFLPDIKLRYINKSLHQLVQLLGFVDYGKVMRKNALVGEKKQDEISGAGAGVSFSFNENVDFKVEVGWPVGDQQSSDGANSQVYMYGMVWF
jgi:hemolysin activation/secretion protein